MVYVGLGALSLSTHTSTHKKENPSTFLAKKQQMMSQSLNTELHTQPNQRSLDSVSRFLFGRGILCSDVRPTKVEHACARGNN